MPTPAYIICSDIRSEDKQTNRISLFNVVEKITATLTTSAAPNQDNSTSPTIKSQIQIPFEATITSVWLFDECDLGANFENKLHFEDAGGNQTLAFTLPPVKASKEDKSPGFHRVTVNFHGLPPLPTPGVWRIVNSLRSMDDADGDWMSQSVPIIFEANEAYLSLIQNTTSRPVVTTRSTAIGRAD